MSSSKVGVVPGRGSTTAATRWPEPLVGHADDQHVEHVRVRHQRASTSSGKTFSPPVFTQVLPRPSRVIVPSASCRAKSPGTV